jgi:hypothetical protein
MTASTETAALVSGGWTTAALEILQRSREYYGGPGGRRRPTRIRLVPERLTGLLPRLKGVDRTFPIPRAIDIYPQERRTIFLAYPREGCTGVFDNGSVRIEDGSEGEKTESSPRHRDTFSGVAKNRSWTPIDALYFFGYALWHYHALPFELSEARLVRMVPAVSGSAVCSVEVEFPPDVPTHSRRQTFYFDGSGQLVRHDYVADIVGAWARGAHFWRRPRLVNGFPIAMERRVAPQIGGRVFPGTALYATFSHAEVEFDPAALGTTSSNGGQ